jgi:cytochrome c peroxidase
MGMTVDDVVSRLAGDDAYRGLTAASMAQSLASYVRSIRSLDSAFDRHLRGGEALTPLEQEGFRLFRDKARCYICHSGDHFTDEVFHNTGVAWKNSKLADRGRAGVTGKPYHNGAFKTPTLREVSKTAPYMHDGSMATLEEVVEFYNRGGVRNPWLDAMIEPLRLSGDEKRALVAFLKALSGTVKHGR